MKNIMREKINWKEQGYKVGHEVYVITFVFDSYSDTYNILEKKKACVTDVSEEGLKVSLSFLKTKYIFKNRLRVNKNTFRVVFKSISDFEKQYKLYYDKKDKEEHNKLCLQIKE